MIKWFIRGYIILMLVYTGWRTWDFITQTLPDNDGTFWLAILFLFATEVGLFMWHEISMRYITTYFQLYIATTLMWVDFVASIGAGVADMILRQTVVNYQVPMWLGQALIYGLPLIVAANVAGAMMYLSNDADLKKQRARKMLDFEADEMAIRYLTDHKRNLVAARKKEITADIAEDWHPAALPLITGTQATPAAINTGTKKQNRSNGHTEEKINLNPTSGDL